MLAVYFLAVTLRRNKLLFKVMLPNTGCKAQRGSFSPLINHRCVLGVTWIKWITSQPHAYYILVKIGLKVQTELKCSIQVPQSE